MDPLIKLKYTIDILFGHNTSKFLPKPMTFFFSYKNGRLRNVYYNDQLLCTLRIDGGLAISIFLATMLLKNAKFLTYCLEVDKVSKPFIEKGRSVFCNHVTWCGKNVHIQSDGSCFIPKQSYSYRQSYAVVRDDNFAKQRRSR